MEQDPFSESRLKSSKRALAQKNGRKKPGLKRPGELDTSGQLLNIFGISLPSNASRQEVFQAALKLSVTGGDFIDTRVYLFSRRTASGIVKRPRPVFVNSTVLRAMSPDLDTCALQFDHLRPNTHCIPLTDSIIRRFLGERHLPFGPYFPAARSICLRRRIPI